MKLESVFLYVYTRWMVDSLQWLVDESTWICSCGFVDLHPYREKWVVEIPLICEAAWLFLVNLSVRHSQHLFPRAIPRF
jgi:hypothetical protein